MQAGQSAMPASSPVPLQQLGAEVSHARILLWRAACMPTTTSEAGDGLEGYCGVSSGCNGTLPGKQRCQQGPNAAPSQHITRLTWQHIHRHQGKLKDHNMDFFLWVYHFGAAYVEADPKGAGSHAVIPRGCDRALLPAGCNWQIRACQLWKTTGSCDI